jgi:hypothetical protein
MSRGDYPGGGGGGGGGMWGNCHSHICLQPDSKLSSLEMPLGKTELVQPTWWYMSVIPALQRLR